MKTNTIQYIKFGCLLFLICFMIVSCTSPTSEILSIPTLVPEKATPGFINNGYIQNSSIAQMIADSPLIVIAQAVKMDHIINMARDADDPSQSAKDVYAVGQVYEVNISKVMKGNETGTIYLVQPEGFLGSSEMKSEVNILESKKRYDYIPITLEKKYLMFLHPMTSYPEENLYTGTFQPWRFDLSNPDQVVAESPWKFATYVFPPQPLDRLLESIEHPEKITPVPPYPPPGLQPAYPSPQETRPSITQ